MHTAAGAPGPDPSGPPGAGLWAVGAPPPLTVTPSQKVKDDEAGVSQSPAPSPMTSSKEPWLSEGQLSVTRVCSLPTPRPCLVSEPPTPSNSPRCSGNSPCSLKGPQRSLCPGLWFRRCVGGPQRLLPKAAALLCGVGLAGTHLLNQDLGRGWGHVPVCVCTGLTGRFSHDDA